MSPVRFLTGLFYRLVLRISCVFYLDTWLSNLFPPSVACLCVFSIGSQAGVFPLEEPSLSAFPVTGRVLGASLQGLCLIRDPEGFLL